MATNYLKSILQHSNLDQLHDKKLRRYHNRIQVVDMYLRHDMSNEFYNQCISSQRNDLEQCSQDWEQLLDDLQKAFVTLQLPLTKLQASDEDFVTRGKLLNRTLLGLYIPLEDEYNSGFSQSADS